MGMARNVWKYILFNNPSGLTCLIVIWVMGGLYWLASFVGIVERVNDWVMFKVLVFCGLFAFSFFPVWNFFILGKSGSDS